MNRSLAVSWDDIGIVLRVNIDCLRIYFEVFSWPSFGQRKSSGNGHFACSTTGSITSGHIETINKDFFF